jgi:hypothetical protein
MDKCTQFSVFLANKPGVLGQIYREVAKAKVNVLALAVMDTMEHGVLRIVVDDAAGVREVLKGINAPVTETDVLAVPVVNRPGSVADLCEKLSTAHINIAYMYGTGGTKGGKTTVILKVPDIKKASRVLDNTQTNRRGDVKIKLRRPKATKKSR